MLRCKIRRSSLLGLQYVSENASCQLEDDYVQSKESFW